MGKVQSFKDLIIWQKSHQLTLNIYQLTKQFPKDEKFGITSQIRRASYSIPANIVEGFKRRNNNEFKQFINIASASLEELKYFFVF